ncbi:MAG: methyltransferase domain-containing protein [bacterium]
MTTSLLPSTDLETIKTRYQSRFATHGATVAALASGTEAKQLLRHRVLSEAVPLEGRSVLDLGSGLGHFYGFLRTTGWRGDYTGVDLVPEFVAHCDHHYGADSPRPTFYAEDLFAVNTRWETQGEAPDLIVASQVFNNRYAEADNWSLFADAVTRMFASCRVGVAVDALTTQVDFEEPQLYYYDPARVLALGLSLTRRAILRHDYPLYEQTLYLYRE